MSVSGRCRVRLLALALTTAALLLAGCASSPPPTTSTGPVNAVAGACHSHKTNDSALRPTWVLATSKGDIKITLDCDKTPITAQNVVNLTESGYFDGTLFHRVIQGFMDQGGDPNTKRPASSTNRYGTGGPGFTIPDEFSCADGTIDHRMDDPPYDGSAYKPCGGNLGLKHDDAGVVAMANTGQPNTGGSQFFIDAAPQHSLDGTHPVFGHTADKASLDVALAINGVPTDANDQPTQPVTITKATVDWSK